jgi:hypothetical protein
MATDNERESLEPDLSLLLRPEVMQAFHELLQRGVLVKALIGTTIQSFLCDTLGLDPRYVESTIQTVFLNGKAVDDPASAVITDQATIALSAAMPGLLGATLRKGSYYARMRGEISHIEREAVARHEGKVLLKLFNLLPRDIGPSILEKGIWVNGKDLKAFFGKHQPIFLEGCRRAMLDGTNLDVERLAEQDWPGDVFLRVRIE